MILLDGGSLELGELRAIADDYAPVALAPSAAAGIDASRAVVDRKAAGTEAVYGINTGFGALAETPIPRDALGALQLNLLRSHAAGVGEPLPVRAVRASMALRANVLAKGFSGIRRSTIELLLDMLNRRVHPKVPSRGSVGASGDLAPLAHLSLVLIGEGDATVGEDPRVMSGREALAAAGLSPTTLMPKEGLALINGTQPSTAVAAPVRPSHSCGQAACRPARVSGEHLRAACRQRNQPVARTLRARTGCILTSVCGADTRCGARCARLRPHDPDHRGQCRHGQPHGLRRRR